MMEQALALFLDTHNLRPEQENSRSYIFNCPACGGGRKLYIEKETGKSKCFKGSTDRCPSSGSPVYALSLLTGLNFKDVDKQIFDLDPVITTDENFNIDFKDVGKVEVQASPAAGDDIPLDIIPIFDPMASEGVTYLEGRGITKDMMIKYNFLYSPVMRRVVFPVVMNNVLYGWQGRAIDKVDKAYRMYNMPGPWKALTLMFYQNLKGSEHAILAEGPVSALKFEKVGGFIASMGKDVSDQQLDLILKSGVKRVYLALDRDAADKIQSIRNYLKSSLKYEVQCYNIDVPEHRDDFGDCTYDECAEMFKQAKVIDPDDLFINVEVKSFIRTKL